VRDTSANRRDILVFSARRLPALAYPDSPHVVLRSLEQLTLMVRESVVVEHNVQRTIVPLVSDDGRRCRVAPHDLSLDFGAHVQGCPIDRHVQPRVFRTRPDLAGRVKTHHNDAHSRVGLRSAPARLELHIHRFDVHAERPKR
jgi:hypothetical protein